MKSPLEKYKECLRDKTFIFSALSSVLFFGLSLVVNFYAAQYATVEASSSVTDIILSNTRVYNVDGFFVYGSIALTLFIVFLCVIQPRKAPFIIKSLALFVVIRSIFITLTHIGPFATHSLITTASWPYVTKILGQDLFLTFFSGNDFFFSGHTGIPFLMALIYWDNKELRALFLLLSVVFGAVVLLAHLHYSIDVLAAFFITATVYRMAKFFFKRDLETAHE